MALIGGCEWPLLPPSLRGTAELPIDGSKGGGGGPPLPLPLLRWPEGGGPVRGGREGRRTSRGRERPIPCGRRSDEVSQLRLTSHCHQSGQHQRGNKRPPRMTSHRGSEEGRRRPTQKGGQGRKGRRGRSSQVKRRRWHWERVRGRRSREGQWTERSDAVTLQGPALWT